MLFTQVIILMYNNLKQINRKKTLQKPKFNRNCEILK